MTDGQKVVLFTIIACLITIAAIIMAAILTEGHGRSQ